MRWLAICLIVALWNTGSQSAPAQQYMIVTAHPLASQAGYEVLKRGGTAVDAAVAAQMVLTLVEPQSSGIGGGAFLVRRNCFWNGTAAR